MIPAYSKLIIGRELMAGSQNIQFRSESTGSQIMAVNLRPNDRKIWVEVKVDGLGWKWTVRRGESGRSKWRKVDGFEWKWTVQNAKKWTVLESGRSKIRKWTVQKDEKWTVQKDEKWTVQKDEKWTVQKTKSGRSIRLKVKGPKTWKVDGPKDQGTRVLD